MALEIESNLTKILQLLYLVYIRWTWKVYGCDSSLLFPQFPCYISISDRDYHSGKFTQRHNSENCAAPSTANEVPYKALLLHVKMPPTRPAA